ncbi:MAG: tetratricopeptide repeat protein [Chthoniobacteraceae bacterium]
MLLLLVMIAAYQQVWHAGFVWDDDAHLTANPCIVGPLGLKDIWTSAHARICPLVQTTFWLEHRMWGLDPLPFHLVNVLMHTAAALVLWRVLLCLRVRGAWLGTVLWALHPVQVETVAWVTELKNTQSCFFYLLSILFFSRSKWVEQERDPKKSAGLYYSLAVVWGVLAMASKSSTVILPFVLGLCAWWITGKLSRRSLFQLIPFFVMSGLAGILSLWTQKVEGVGGGPYWTINGMDRILVAGRVVWFYLWKLLWPHPLIFFYPRWEISAGNLPDYLPTTAVIVAFIVLWRCRNSGNGWGRPVFLAWTYFVMALLPVLGLLNHYFLRFSFVGDHFQYMASMGPLALAGAGITLFFDSRKDINPNLQGVFYATLFATLGWLTWSQCGMYRDVETLWQTTVARNPDCWIAYNNLGNILQQSGDVDGGIAYFEKSLQIRPYDAEAVNNLGIAMLRKGRLDKAVYETRKALAMDPNSAEIYGNLGNVFLQKGMVDEAMENYEKSLAINPRDQITHYNLGNVLLNQKHEYEEAVYHLKQCVEIERSMGTTENVYADYDLGIALTKTGKFKEAATNYQRTLELLPQFTPAQGKLAWLLATCPDGTVRDGTQALDLAQKANQAVGGQDPNTLKILAAAYAEAGQFDNAMETARQALSIVPETDEAMIEALNKQLALYQAGKPFHEEKSAPQAVQSMNGSDRLQ